MSKIAGNAQKVKRVALPDRLLLDGIVDFGEIQISYGADKAVPASASEPSDAFRFLPFRVAVALEAVPA